ncbi:MAG: cytochrome c [Armatimonadetes bacterium]|nr:cytochrome c [Armatimonadota bacterium]
MRRALLLIGLLAIVWIVIPGLPHEWGLRFGLLYRGFFSALLVAALLFYALLRRRPARGLPSPARALAGIVLVYLGTVGTLVAIGIVYPQFEVPRATRGQEEVARAEVRGKELFVALGCIGCHSVKTMGVRGGTRAPDLSGIGKRGATRIPGVPAQEYVREHIKRGSSPGYYMVPGYPPIMPPFGALLSQEKLNDLLAYLMAAREE